jgi:hypothetical protein
MAASWKIAYGSFIDIKYFQKLLNTGIGEVHAYNSYYHIIDLSIEIKRLKMKITALQSLAI